MLIINKNGYSINPKNLKEKKVVVKMFDLVDEMEIEFYKELE